MWERVRALQISACADLINQGFKPADISSQAYLNLRFQGTDTALMTPASFPAPPAAEAPEPGMQGLGSREAEGGGGDAIQAFFDQYR